MVQGFNRTSYAKVQNSPSIALQTLSLTLSPTLISHISILVHLKTVFLVSQIYLRTEI